jgi:hypothetical protein
MAGIIFDTQCFRELRCSLKELVIYVFVIKEKRLKIFGGKDFLPGELEIDLLPG